MFSGRIIDKVFSVKSQEDLSTSHVFEAAIGLHPVPFLAKDFGNVGTPFGPMLINDGLNELQIGVSDGPFSDSQWQHDHCITEKGFGRHRKIKKVKKIFGQGRFNQKIG